jgi:hypothetical protein
VVIAASFLRIFSPGYKLSDTRKEGVRGEEAIFKLVRDDGLYV